RAFPAVTGRPPRHRREGPGPTPPHPPSLGGGRGRGQAGAGAPSRSTVLIEERVARNCQVHSASGTARETAAGGRFRVTISRLEMEEASAAPLRRVRS